MSLELCIWLYIEYVSLEFYMWFYVFRALYMGVYRIVFMYVLCCLALIASTMSTEALQAEVLLSLLRSLLLFIGMRHIAASLPYAEDQRCS